jgi:glycosyltransferase involved in cell wall biosynthesis
MKPVLFISIMNGSPWGGSEEMWHHAALWMSQNNYRADVCCFDWPQKQDKLLQLMKAGCKLYLLPGKKETKSILGKLKLKKALQAVPFADYEIVVINQGGWKDVTHWPFKKLYTRLPRYVLIFHNYNTSGKLADGRINSLRKWVNNAHVNLAGAGKIFSVLKEIYGINAPRQDVLYNPVTFTPPDTVIPFSISPENKIILSMVATLDKERKAQDILLKTLGQKKWKDRNWELNLYGDGKDKSILEKLVAELQLQSKVFLKGYTDNVKQVLRDSHVILQMTHIDAMPVSVVEAMAMSRPIAVSDVGDMPLWVKNGINGWVTEKVTMESIDRTLEQVWAHRNKWDEMGENSYRIFQQKYPASPVIFFLNQAGILCDENNKT